MESYKSYFNRSFEILKSEIQSIKENGVDYGMWKRDDFMWKTFMELRTN